MKTTLIAAAFVVAGTPLLAEGFAFSGEVDSTYNIDSEKAIVTLTPEINYGIGKANFELKTPIAVYNNKSTASSDLVLFDALEDGSYPLLKAEATYMLRDDLELSAGSSWDLNKGARGDITIGASFNF